MKFAKCHVDEENVVELTQQIFSQRLEEFCNDLPNVWKIPQATLHTRLFKQDSFELFPRANILMIFDEKSAIKKAQHVDKIVCAEIPNPNTSPTLHKLVSEFMMTQPAAERCHVGCVETCFQTSNKGGFFQYPKEFATKTRFEKQSEPVYRRRSPKNGGFQARVLIDSETQKTVMVDNRWVIPYNPFLLKKYKTYIKVDVRSSCVAKDFLEFLDAVCEKKSETKNQEEIWCSSVEKANKFVETCQKSSKTSTEYPFEV